VAEARQICPACGADLDALSARDYRVKLLAALHHPLDDVRMRARRFTLHFRRYGWQ
jgi:hypothetical protein